MSIEVWVGIDWGNEEHQFCVVNAKREVVLEDRVKHSAAGVRVMIERVLSFGPVDSIAVAIETPRGPVVDGLLDRGVLVYAINPKQLDRFRDRHNVAGAKDDRRDAFVLATSLATDTACFREARLKDARLVELRQLERLHAELAAENTALGNRLHDQLLRYYPQILELGSVYTDMWIWELLRGAPSPASAKKLSKTWVAAVLKAHRVRRRSVEEVIGILRGEALVVAPGVTAGATRYLDSLLPRLELVRSHLKACTADMKKLLDAMQASNDPASETKVEPRDVQVVRSLPGVGTHVGATLLVEASTALRDRDYHALRALAGVAPVTRATGKRSGAFAQVTMRHACNERLRSAVFYWALGSVTRDPRARAHYAKLRAKGHGHARALRGVGDRLLSMLVAMLRDGATYDSSRRQAPA